MPTRRFILALIATSSVALLAASIAAAAARAEATTPVLLVLGDSISAGYGLAKGSGWVDLLAKRIEAQHLSWRVVNASISGDTTAGGRARLPALLAQHKPGIVIVELGGNDGLRGGNLRSTKDNLDSMVAAARKAGAQAVVVGMKLPPNYGPAYTREFEALLRRRREIEPCAARPVPLRRLRRVRRVVPARPRPSDGGGASKALGQRMARTFAAAREVTMKAAAPNVPPRDNRTITVDKLAAYPDRIDVRSPSEFIEDHIPGAENRPVLDDAERARIGTMYAKESGFAAKRAGAAIVARNIADDARRSVRDKPRGWSPVVYCWRGGQRSRSLAHLLNEIGWRAVQLEGGYRAWRRHVIAQLETLPSQFRFAVICGLTGSGKSRLLDALATIGTQVLDLEALAKHRGSLLGDLPDEAQPTQKTFDSELAVALQRFDPRRIVYVESESKKIGTVQVPDALLAAMRSGDCIRVDTPPPLAHRASEGRVRALSRRPRSAFGAPRPSRSAAWTEDD